MSTPLAPPTAPEVPAAPADIRPPSITRGDHRTETHSIVATDGTLLTLLHVRGPREPDRGPVLLVHGAGVRAELFRPPIPYTIVDSLLDRGWDVWLLNWRASIDLPLNPWTLTAAALHDHPVAVRAIREATGAASLSAIVHCQGSTSFALAAAAGLLPDVDTIVSNAVALHPVIPAFARFKLLTMAPWISRMTGYLSPAWAYRSDGVFSRITRRAVALTHPECDNLVCRMVSFTYGSGRPALWSHRHLDERTHDWITGEFAAVPMSFFAEMGPSVRAGHLVPSAGSALPADAATTAPRSAARFALFAGEDNRCFLPESQRRTFAHLERYQPGRHSLHIIKGYGHLDVFLGRDAWRDVHPLMLKELER